MRSKTFDELFQEYRTRGILLDTNLLLLLISGNLGADFLRRFKPVMNQGYTMNDFELLRRFCGGFSKIITTPHILTEVSNHAEKAKQKECVQSLRRFIQNSHEEFTQSKLVCMDLDFEKLGLADAAICRLSPSNFLVLTVDFPLAGRLTKRGADVINFNHLRQMNWERSKPLVA